MFPLLAIDWGFVLVTVLNAGLVFFVALNMAGMLTWVERKQGAVMANRIGANRAYIPVPTNKKDADGKMIWSKRFTLIGMFHTIADGGKMIIKEDFDPPFVDRFVYNAAPWFAIIPAFLVFAVVPFGGAFQPGHVFDGSIMAWLADSIGFVDVAREWTVSTFGDRVMRLQVADLDMGILFVFAVGSVGVFAAALAGWSSNNKFSLLGALRASAQMISYEVFVGISILAFFVLHGTLNFAEVVDNQAGTKGILFWGVVAQLPMLFVFLTGLMAENKRVPFDMPESESELVAGYMTEYSAMKMGLFMMSEFVEVAVIGALVTVLFLGGPFLPGMGFTDIAGQPVLSSFLGISLSPLLAAGLMFVVFWSKVIFVCWFQILIRWTVPKFRYDQIMYLGWRIMLPLCMVNLFVTAGIVGFGSEFGWSPYMIAGVAGIGSLLAFGISIAIGTSGGRGSYQHSQLPEGRSS